MNLYNVEFNILLDTASSVTLITKGLAKTFQLRSYKLSNPFNVTSINGTQVIGARRYCILPFQIICSDYSTIDGAVWLTLYINGSIIVADINDLTK